MKLSPGGCEYRLRIWFLVVGIPFPELIAVDLLEYHGVSVPRRRFRHPMCVVDVGVVFSYPPDHQ